MKAPRIKAEVSTIAVVPMTNVKLQWASEGMYRDGLSEGHPDTFFGVWQHGALLCMTPVHGIAIDIALLQAGDAHNVVDLSASTILLAGQETWTSWPDG